MFYGFWQAKFAGGGLILVTVRAASNNDTQVKSGSNWLKNKILPSLIEICDTLRIVPWIHIFIW